MGVMTHERGIDGLQVLSIRGDCVARVVWETERTGKKFQTGEYRLLLLPRPTDVSEFYARVERARLGKPDVLVEITIPSEFERRWLDHQTQVLRSDKRLEKLLGVTGNSGS